MYGDWLNPKVPVLDLVIILNALAYSLFPQTKTSPSVVCVWVLFSPLLITPPSYQSTHVQIPVDK